MKSAFRRVSVPPWQFPIPDLTGARLRRSGGGAPTEERPTLPRKTFTRADPVSVQPWQRPGWPVASADGHDADQDADDARPRR